MCYFSFRIFIKFGSSSVNLSSVGGTSVLTMSSQDKIRKLQRKSAFMAFYDHFC